MLQTFVKDLNKALKANFPGTLSIIHMSDLSEME